METVTTVEIARRPAGALFIFRKLIWALALTLMCLGAADGVLTFQIQSGAPQQAVAAASACFHMITVYVIARGFDALLRAPGE